MNNYLHWKYFVGDELEDLNRDSKIIRKKIHVM